MKGANNSNHKNCKYNSNKTVETVKIRDEDKTHRAVIMNKSNSI